MAQDGKEAFREQLKVLPISQAAVHPTYRLFTVPSPYPMRSLWEQVESFFTFSIGVGGYLGPRELPLQHSCPRFGWWLHVPQQNKALTLSIGLSPLGHRAGWGGHELAGCSEQKITADPSPFRMVCVVGGGC